MRITDCKVVLQKDITRESEEIKRLETMDIEDYYYFYYPSKEKLVVNSLLAGLLDGSSYINRGVIEYLTTHMPITGNINSIPENVRLVEGCLLTLYKKDYAFIKKFFTWFFSHLEEEDSRPSLEDPAIKTLVPALQSLFIKYMDKSAQGSGVGADKWNPSKPILILISLLSDNNIQINEPVLEAISVDLIKYIKKYFYDD